MCSVKWEVYKAYFLLATYFIFFFLLLERLIFYDQNLLHIYMHIYLYWTSLTSELGLILLTHAWPQLPWHVLLTFLKTANFIYYINPCLKDHIFNCGKAQEVSDKNHKGFKSEQTKYQSQQSILTFNRITRIFSSWEFDLVYTTLIIFLSEIHLQLFLERWNNRDVLKPEFWLGVEWERYYF